MTEIVQKVGVGTTAVAMATKNGGAENITE